MFRRKRSPGVLVALLILQPRTCDLVYCDCQRQDLLLHTEQKIWQSTTDDYAQVARLVCDRAWNYCPDMMMASQSILWDRWRCRIVEKDGALLVVLLMVSSCGRGRGGRCRGKRSKEFKVFSIGESRALMPGARARQAACEIHESGCSSCLSREFSLRMLSNEADTQTSNGRSPENVSYQHKHAIMVVISR